MFKYIFYLIQQFILNMEKSSNVIKPESVEIYRSRQRGIPQAAAEKVVILPPVIQ
jgi:hypothetical protein